MAKGFTRYTLTWEKDNIPTNMADELLKCHPGVELSKRQKQFLELRLKTLTQQEIADKLCVSLKTCKFHFGNIYKKFGVKNMNKLYKKIISINLNEINTGNKPGLKGSRVHDMTLLPVGSSTIKKSY